MSGRLFLSLDLGTTAVKVALWSLEVGRPGRASASPAPASRQRRHPRAHAEARLLALSVQELSLLHPAPEQLEIDAQTVWEAVVGGTAQVLAQAPSSDRGRAGGKRGQGRSLPDVAGIGLSSQAQTFVLLDDADKPVRRAVMWLDARAAKEAEEFRQEFSAEDSLRHLGRPGVDAIASAPKLRWLRKHEPRTLARARTLLLLPDYVLYRLTGERVTDPVTAGSTGLCHSLRREWWAEAAEFAGVGHLRLPAVKSPGEVAGTLRPQAAGELGLTSGVPCAVGTNDQLTGALGAGNVEAGTVSETTGTALALVLTAPAEGPELPSGVGAGPHPASGRLRYLLAYSKTAGIILRWFRDCFFPGAPYEAIFAKVAEAPIGCDGVTCLPHFSGTATPHFNPEATGAFLGLRLGHTASHLARAIVESLTFDLALNLRLLSEVAGEIGTIRAMGGGARSDLWLQMKADVLGRAVERVTCPEAASLGAAELAMVATGDFGSVAEASLALYRSDRLFTPDRDRGARYAEPLQRYESWYRKLCGKGEG
jgi:sugar (pentulose or hexulose) kinase